uniref:Nitroreductase domain-containing protein n=1 Tax=Glossina morsitans morsitans TaxID=37546 RepID=A0A1B0FFD6_GLOMM
MPTNGFFEKSIFLSNWFSILLVTCVAVLLRYLLAKVDVAKYLWGHHHEGMADDLANNSKEGHCEEYFSALPEVEHVPYIGATITLPGGSRQFYEMANNRRSVRAFKPHPIPAFEVIENCILAAGCAPSGAHTEPWTFCVISNKDLKHRIRCIVEREEEINYAQRMSKQWRNDLRPLKTNHVKSYLTDAPYLILVLKQVYGFTKSGKRKQHYYNEISVSIAVGILLCALQAAGLSSLVTTPLNCGAALCRLLKRPINEKLLVLMPIGYPSDNCLIPNFKRKELKDIVFVK